MGIYRTAAGRESIRTFARERLDRWPVDHQRRVLNTSAGPTHVVSTGDGEPVVLLAGTNFCSSNWLGLVEQLAESHRVHAVDLPGQPGLSSDQRPRHASVAYGGWLAELLPLLAPDEAVVVGHSLGARVALAGASAAGIRQRLVLVDPAGVMRLSVTASMMRSTIPWLRNPDAATSAALLSMMMAPGNAPSEELIRWMSLVGQHVRTSLAPRSLTTSQLRGLTDTPIVVVSGEHDAFLPPPRLARAMRRKLPRAGLTFLADAGHLLPHERPDAIVSAVQAWL